MKCQWKQNALRIVLLLLSVSCLLTAAGCWDDAEINGRAFVLGFGADAGPEEGRYDFTFQLAIPVSGNAESSGAIQYTNCTVTESSVASAIRLLEKDMGRQVNFEQLNVIVIGEELSKGNFLGMTELFFRRASVRRQSCVAVCAGSAKDFFGASVTDNAVASDAAVALQSYDDTGSADAMALNLHSLYKVVSNADEFYLLKMTPCAPDALSEDVSNALSDTETNDGQKKMLRISGAAAYGRQGNYLGELDEQELELLRLITNRQISGVVAAKEADGSVIDYQIKQSHCESECSLQNGVPVFTVRLHLSCIPIDGSAIGGINTGSHNFTERARRDMTETLTARLDALAARSRQSLGSSVLGLQDKLRQRMPDWYEQHADNWEDIYRKSSIEVEVDCTVIGGGIIR